MKVGDLGILQNMGYASKERNDNPYVDTQYLNGVIAEIILVLQPGDTFLKNRCAIRGGYIVRVHTSSYDHVIGYHQIRPVDDPDVECKREIDEPIKQGLDLVV